MIDRVQNHLHHLWNTVTLEATKVFPQILVGIVIFFLSWLLAVMVKFCIIRLASRSKNHLYLYRLIASTVKMIILIGGLVTALGTMGINVAALVASIGLAGFAVGFALKDTLSNLIAGFLVLFYQPFHVSDYIALDKIEGQVINITLRFTVVTLNGQHTYIPNAMMLNTPLTVKQMTSEKS